MYAKVMIRSLLAIAILTNLAASAPVPQPLSISSIGSSAGELEGETSSLGGLASEEGEGVTAPSTSTPEEEAPPAAAPATQPAAAAAPAAASSGGKLSTIAGGIGAAGGLLGGLGTVGNLFNTILHEPSTTSGPSCGFFHKLINDCPAPAATAAPATTSTAVAPVVSSSAAAAPLASTSAVAPPAGTPVIGIPVQSHAA